MNSGPGKSPRRPIPDSATASSAARSASRSNNSGEDSGSAGMKSTVPAKRVFSPSVAKRVIFLMPDLPATRLFQVSALPAPSEVTTPMPVTTTIGRPALSWWGGMRFSLGGFHECQSFAAPMADGGDDHLRQRAVHRALDARFVD